MFVHSAKYSVERERPLGSDDFVKFYLFEVDGEQIAESYSSVIEGASYPSVIALDNDFLYIANSERDWSIDPRQPNEYFLNIHIYSVAEISNPQLMSKVSVKSEGLSYPFFHSMNLKENWLVLNTVEKAYLYDVSDLERPQYIASIDRMASSNYWYNGYWLHSESSKGISVFEPTREGFVEIGLLSIPGIWNFDIKDDYLYVAHLNRGLDIFKLTFDETSVGGWSLY